MTKTGGTFGTVLDIIVTIGDAATTDFSDSKETGDFVENGIHFPQW